MAPDRPSTCVTRGRGSENPARAHGGSTAWLTAGLHGVVDVLGRRRPEPRPWRLR